MKSVPMRQRVTEESQRVSDDGVSLELTKVLTGGGERLEIYAPRLDTRLYLDALAIEGLSWGDEETLREITASVYGADELDDSAFESIDGDDVTTSDAIEVSNEFGLGAATIVTNGDRKRVAFRSPKLGYENQLSVKTVEAITTQDGEMFTQFLTTPFGPKGHHH